MNLLTKEIASPKLAKSAGSYIKIGCEGYSLKDWLENYEKIGKVNNYTDKQIKDYGDFLKYLAKRKP